MKKSIFTNLMKRIDQSFIDVDKINNEFIDVIKKYIEIDSERIHLFNEYHNVSLTHTKVQPFDKDDFIINIEKHANVTEYEHLNKDLIQRTLNSHIADNVYMKQTESMITIGLWNKPPSYI